MILLVLAVSGCTIPGTDIVIPIPWFGGSTIDYTDDIIVIKNLQVTPGTKVKAGQTLTLYADIQNTQDPELAAGEKIKTVSIDLYDHCTNLFEGNPAASVNTECQGTFDMSPQEIRTCIWTLTPRDVSLITQCELKVKVNYHHETETTTSIAFIDAAELDNRIRRGESWQKSGSTTRGYGPVKVYLEVETQQPVPDSDSGEGASASISMKIRNVGQGYVKDSAILESQFTIPKLPSELQWVDGQGDCNFDMSKFTSAGGGSKTGIKLVRKETTPKFCNIASPDVEIEQTYDISTSVEYDYEFRKSLHIQIEPR